ncbi:MAG: DNA topoisomerase [Lachnospiraceae bacterium]|nr:DNA topoisomerase [Lachnospiraceae bacterium]
MLLGRINSARGDGPFGSNYFDPKGPSLRAEIHFKEEKSIKDLYIAEKPSVAREFARTLHVTGSGRNGYMESDTTVVTWCVGHLVTMSYPEAYDPKYKKWSLDTLPFIPDKFLYEVIPNVKEQFEIVKSLLSRKDVDRIYVCTDSGREGEYIYRLVEMMCGGDVSQKDRRRVWIDSFTDEEIARGIREAKPLSSYDNLSDSAYLRAKEDYLMGINFSRLLTLKYGYGIQNYLGGKWSAVSVGRVMTCVLGMVVRREREIREFVKTPFYRVIGTFEGIEAEWKAVPGSAYYIDNPKLPGISTVANQIMPDANAAPTEIATNPAAIPMQTMTGANANRAQSMTVSNGTAKSSAQKEDGKKAVTDEAAREAEAAMHLSPLLYKENGFKKREDAEALIAALKKVDPYEGIIKQISRKKEKKNPPLLYNLAELQNDCSKKFKLSPDQTLQIAQELYEKKLTTYPRTDARVLSSAVAKEIDRNLKGLARIGDGDEEGGLAAFANEILSEGSWQTIANTRYTDDKAITDHYAIIPTGSGLNALKSLSPTSRKVYDIIARRFLAIFYPPAVYEKTSVTITLGRESFFANSKVLVEEGWLKVVGGEKVRKGMNVGKLRKGSRLHVDDLCIKEGETSPPKRYTSGSIILAMENAGQLIEDEGLREMIRGSGIGTSATRAEILKKLFAIKYLNLNKKTQIITPELLGEMVYDTVNASIRPLLNPDLTASWEKGLTGVADGTITTDEYMDKLRGFIERRCSAVMGLNNQSLLRQCYDAAAVYYKPAQKTSKPSGARRGTKR